MDEKKRETCKLLLGLFAADIRNDWSWGVSYRIEYMHELMSMIGDCDGPDYEIDEEACIDDGRWMRDEWKGGYWEDIGESDWILENLDMKIIDEYYNGLHYPDKELQKAVEIYRAK